MPTMPTISPAWSRIGSLEVSSHLPLPRAFGKKYDLARRLVDHGFEPEGAVLLVEGDGEETVRLRDKPFAGRNQPKRRVDLVIFQK